MLFLLVFCFWYGQILCLVFIVSGIFQIIRINLFPKKKKKGENDEKSKHSTKVPLGSLILLNDWSFLSFAFSFSFFNFRLYLKGHTGTAGQQSSLVIHGADFSTKDADNDNCLCKCALMLTGGESCGAFL